MRAALFLSSSSSGNVDRWMMLLLFSLYRSTCEYFIVFASVPVLTLRDNFELVTAVLAGDNTLQLRVFSTATICVSEEQLLTRRLCKLMNRHQVGWSR